MARRTKRPLIYGLCDPQTNQIRYVGKSLYGLERPKQHFEPNKLKIKSRKNNWIKSIYKKYGVYPAIVILQECGEKDLDRLEIEFIKKYPNLTNQTEGGTGGNTGKAYLKWKPIIATNLETGEIKRYRYIWEAEDDGFSATKVCAVCKGKRPQHKGFVFQYVDGSSPAYINKKNHKAVRVTIKSSGETIDFSTKIKAAEFLGVSITTLHDYLENTKKTISKLKNQYDINYIVLINKEI